MNKTLSFGVQNLFTFLGEAEVKAGKRTELPRAPPSRRFHHRTRQLPHCWHIKTLWLGQILLPPESRHQDRPGVEKTHRSDRLQRPPRRWSIGRSDVSGFDLSLTTPGHLRPWAKEFQVATQVAAVGGKAHPLQHHLDRSLGIGFEFYSIAAQKAAP